MGEREETQLSMKKKSAARRNNTGVLRQPKVYISGMLKTGPERKDWFQDREGKGP